MEENLDLKMKYERELEDAGMPEKLAPVVAPKDEALGQIILAFPELKDDMLKFKSFSEEIKTYIADSLRELAKKGLPREEIVSRLRLLIERSQHFTRLDGSDSDQRYNPPITEHEEEMEDINVFAEEGAVGSIQRAEEIIKKEKTEIIH